MSWYYEFVLDTPEWQSNRDILINIVEAMLTSDSFTFKDMTVYSYDLLKANRGNITKAKAEVFKAPVSLVPSTLSDWISKYTEPGILFDVVFIVNRFVSINRFVSNGELVQREVRLLALDEHFGGYAAYLPTGMGYDSHSSKLYSAILNPDFDKNMEFLLEELEILIKSGVKTIRGLNNEQSANVMEHRLCYHQEIADFLSDIEQAKPDNFTHDTLLEIIDKCENISSKRILNGLVVWHKWGTDRSLSEFYEALLEWSQDNQV